MTVLATYTYGDSNERLIKDEGGYRTYYATNGGTVIAEYSETPSLPTTPKWSKSYVYLGGRLLSTLTPNGSGGEAVQYHHPDRLGTRLVTDPVAGTSFEQVTLPFGTELNAESTGATNRRFTSYDRRASTVLDYAVNRHYDPQQGRFTQVDPAGMNATSLANPQSFNLYSYVQNDPVNFVDPTGLWCGYVRHVYTVQDGVNPDGITVDYVWECHPDPIIITLLGGGTPGGLGGNPLMPRPGTPQNPSNDKEIQRRIAEGKAWDKWYEWVICNNPIMNKFNAQLKNYHRVGGGAFWLDIGTGIGVGVIVLEEPNIAGIWVAGLGVWKVLQTHREAEDEIISNYKREATAKCGPKPPHP